MNLKKIKILTDSTCDMPKELYEKYDIDVAPLNIHYDNETYLDGVEIDAIKLYELIEKTNSKDHPKTSAVTIGVFEQLIDKYMMQGYDEIFFTGIGSCLSSTNQAFKLAGEKYPGKCFVFDSGNLSSGIAYSLIKAAQYRDQGLTCSQFIPRLLENKNKYVVSFVVKNLDYLHKGGRCKGFAKVFGAALKVRPILRIDHDELYLYKKPAGKFQKALNILIDELIQYNEKGLLDTSYPLFLTHSVCEKEQNYIKEKIEEANIKFKDIYIIQTGTTIGTHCGPGTSGLVYALKNEYQRQ